MEEILKTFLNAFNINTMDNFDRFIIYINSNLRSISLRETDITNLLISQAKPEDLRKVQQLLLSISQHTMKNRNAFLSVLSRIEKNDQLKVDFQKHQAYVQIKKPEIDIEIKHNRTIVMQSPTKILIPDIVYALNGISTDKIKLEIDTVTGLYTIITDFTPSISAFLVEIGTVSGLKLRLQQLVNSLKLSRSKPKQAFSAFCVEYLNTEFQQQLRYISTMDTIEQVLMVVRENLRISLASLCWAGELITSSQLRGCIDYLKVLELVQTSGNGEKLLEAVKIEMEKPMLMFLLQWIQFGDCQDIHGDFFIEEISKNSKKMDLWNDQFKLVNVAGQSYDKVLNIGKSVYFLRKICKIIDFDLLNNENWFDIQSQIKNNSVTFQDINFNETEIFVNQTVNNQLQKKYQISDSLDLIIKVFLGFQSDFITIFAQTMMQNASNQVNQVYRLSAINQLDHCIQSSNLQNCFNQELLSQLNPFILPNNSTFSISFNAIEPLNYVFLQKQMLELKDCFDLVVLTRILELSLNKVEKQSRVKLCLFKIQNLVRFLAGFMQSMFGMLSERISVNFERPQNQIGSYIGFITEFTASITEITLNGSLKMFMNKLYLISGQLISDKLSKMKQQQIGQVRQIEVEVSKIVKELIQDLQSIKTGEFIDEFELLISQLQLSSF
ncbi:Spindle pole body component [Spironucleus salmonicida]|uniref:Spindle pole body component n=1 Tax=Spironucleus salmonicida TaxID=348837 RepID=V6LGS8_9EUKA|nr:Spindle pole body component [Spironucleus salmonicida]|eukprot:EST43712.1 Spindle pole body component [Spironucleus salmonicida]